MTGGWGAPWPQQGQGKGGMSPWGKGGGDNWAPGGPAGGQPGGPAPTWGGGGGGGGQPAARQRLGSVRAVGLLVDWSDKGAKSHGWITPLHGVPTDLPESREHGGDLYVHCRDIQDPRPGAIVTFWPYVDTQGLGAMDVLNRSVLRLALPSSAAAALALPRATAAGAGSYLSSSVFFPELEDRGVTFRKYLWDAPLAVFELWGEPRDIIAVAEEVGLLAQPDAAALISRDMARHEAPDNLHDIPAADLPNVPAKFRVALPLRRGNDARERLLAILGA